SLATNTYAASSDRLNVWQQSPAASYQGYVPSSEISSINYQGNPLNYAAYQNQPQSPLNPSSHLYVLTNSAYVNPGATQPVYSSVPTGNPSYPNVITVTNPSYMPASAGYLGTPQMTYVVVANPVHHAYTR